MTNLLQAAKQALMYLEAYAEGEDVKPYECEGTVLTLRQAISVAEEQATAQTEQTDLNLNCKSVQKRLATLWGYVKAEQQEPVAWWNGKTDDNWIVSKNPMAFLEYPLYTAPPQREIEDYIETNKALTKEIIDLKNREWVEPSDEQIAFVWVNRGDAITGVEFLSIARAVLKLAKELNYG